MKKIQNFDQTIGLKKKISFNNKVVTVRLFDLCLSRNCLNVSILATDNISSKIARKLPTKILYSKSNMAVEDNASNSVCIK